MLIDILENRYITLVDENFKEEFKDNGNIFIKLIKVYERRGLEVEKNLMIAFKIWHSKKSISVDFTVYLCNMIRYLSTDFALFKNYSSYFEKYMVLA
jgi:hypothetical protein